MLNKKYLSFLVVVGILAGLSLSLPAMAATAPGNMRNNPGHGWKGAGRMQPGIFGTVSAITGTTLTVKTKALPNKAAATYTVDAANATVFKNNATSSVADIATGDVIMVRGTVSGTTVTATSIRDGIPARGQAKTGRWASGSVIQGNGQPIIGGNITSASGTTITLTNKSGVTYNVDVSNATVVKGGATSTVANLAVNDNVIVQGTVNGTSVVAASVIDRGAIPNPIGSSTSNRPAFLNFGFFHGIASFFTHLFGF